MECAMAVSRVEMIVWDDAVASTGWCDDKDAGKPQRCRSIGYVVASDARSITLAGTWGVNTETKKMETNNRMTIPKGWIVSRTKVKI